VDAQEFERQVTSGLSKEKGHHPVVAEFISEFTEECPRLGHDDVRLCVKVICRAVENLDDSEPGSSLSSPTPGDFLVSDVLLAKLRPWVEDLRQEGGFDPHEPPFKTPKEASGWIKRTAEAQHTAWLAEHREAVDELYSLAEKLGYRVTRETPRLRYQHYKRSRTVLPLKNPDDTRQDEPRGAQQVATVPGTFLHRLARETDQVAKRTGLRPDALVMHILIGSEPVRPRLWITEGYDDHPLPTGEVRPRRYVTVTFDTPDLTERELQTIHSEIRGYIGGKGTNAFHWGDLTFWEFMEEFIQDVGPLPEKRRGRGKYWEEARQRWNREYATKNEGHTYYGSANGVKQRYNKLQKRLGV